MAEEEKKDAPAVEAEAPQEHKEEESKQTTAPKDEPAKTEEVLPLEDIQKEEDGTYTLKVGESIYKGKTPNEVLKNLVTGVADKDSYIAKLKVSHEKVKTPEKKEETVEEVQPPDISELYRAHFEREVKKSKVDPKVFALTSREDWRNYASEKELEPWEVMELKEEVKAINKTVEELTNKDATVLNKAFLSSQEIEIATPRVREMVEELLTAEQMKEFDYEQVLDTVSKASKDFVHSGEVVYEAQKQINKIIRKNSAVKKDLDAVIEKGEEAKGKIKTPSGGGTRHETQTKRYSSYEAVRADIMKDINAGRA